MHILLFLLFGLSAGLISRALAPGHARGGWLMALTLGIVGALVGGYLGRALDLYGPGQPAGFLISLAGAVALLFAYHVLQGFRASA